MRRMPPAGPDGERERAEEARRVLGRLTSEAEFLGSPPAASAVDRAGRHFGAADIDPADKIEIWGTRIGRGLGFLVALGLAAYLAWTYLR